MALIDSLTGIANRRKFEAGLGEEWRRAIRSRQALSIAIVDVDYFKKFNDRYGHARGDACLRHVARVIAGTCHRPGDLAARYGGEEFALVLPQTESEGARTVLVELLANVEKLSIEHLA